MEPFLVFFHRHLDNLLATELDGGADVRSTDLPVTQLSQHHEELVSTLLVRFHLMT